MSYTPNIDVDDVFMFNLKLHQGITNKETVSCIYKSYHTSHISSSIESTCNTMQEVEAAHIQYQSTKFEFIMS